MMDIAAVIDLDDCESSIKWRLTDCCNFKCSYCIRRSWARVDQTINELKRDYETAIRVAPEINRLIEELPGKTVKLDLIGGEVTLLDLLTILKAITSSKLKRINITTNFSASFSYFRELIDLLYSRGTILGITASCHLEFTNIDTYFEKLKRLNDECKGKVYIKGEIVSCQNNQDIIKEYIERCQKDGIAYIIDRDMRGPGFSREGLICGASSNKNPRYRIIKNDGTELLFKSRNEFITGTNVYNYNRHSFTCVGYYCTRDYNYTYVEKDIHRGKLSDTRKYGLKTEDPTNCNHECPVEQFHILSKPTQCLNYACSLCGHFSVARDINLLVKK